MTWLVIAVLALAVINLAFAAFVVLLRIANVRRTARLVQRKSVWYPRIIGLISDGSDPRALAASVEPKERGDVVEIAWDITRRLRGADRLRVQLFATPLLDVLTPDLKARRPETRARALQVATCLGGDEYEQLSADFLDDRSQLVSLVAARALSQPVHASRIGEVLDQLDRYQQWSQALTSSMLAEVGMEAAPVMRTYLGNGAQPAHTRAAVARSLELLRDIEAASVAADQLADSDPELLAACLRLLCVVGTEAQAEAVRPLVDDERFFISAAAMTALGRLGSPDDAMLIVSAIDRESPWIAIRAAQALAELHASAELAVLVTDGGLPAEAAVETLYGGAA